MSDASLSDTAPSSSSLSAPIPIRPSGRKGNRKVRTGCITCKIRKVKCDEAKPSCLRCVNTGRKCDGYAPARPRARRHQAAAASAAASSLVLSPLSQSPDFESIDEFRAFDYYRAKARTLVGASGIPAADDFWGGLVVRMCFTESVVRHAVLAMSSLHESVVTRGKTKGTSFAFREYGKAIAAMREYSSSEPAAVPLLVCVLFICIEFMLEYTAAAQLHICQGRRMLSRMGQQEQPGFSSPAMEVIKKDLVPIYARLSLASYLFGSRPAPIPALLIPGGGKVPAVFTSLSEARDSLHHLVDAGLALSTAGKPAVYNPQTDPLELQRLKATQHDLLVQLSQWHSAFAVLQTTLPPGVDTAVQDILHVYHSAGTIWMSTALDPLELGFDSHIAHFASIITHANSAIAELKNQSSFAFETEIVPPVFWAVEKCRHPLLRRAALGILKRKELRGRKENLWRIDQAASVATKVLEVEETGLDFGLDAYRDVEAQVSIFAPPTLKPPYYCITDLTFGESAMDTLESSDAEKTPDHPSPSSSASGEHHLGEPMPKIDPAHLLSPFGLPEGRRIKNALIGEREEGGLWMTTFTDPVPGELEWDVRKIWVSL